MQQSGDTTTKMIDRLSKLSSPVVSDAMSKLPQKLKHQTMDSGIKPIDRSFRVCGPAYTVQCYAGATFAMEKAVAEAPKESVIVCNGQGSEAGVMLGELMSTFAQKRGVHGIVVDGAVRDIDSIIEIGFPVFTRHITACSGTFDKLGEIGQTITCGSVVVSPGDVIVGDVNGVVVVPAKIAGEVTDAAEKLHQWEQDVKSLLLQGKTLEEAAYACPRPSSCDIK